MKKFKFLALTALFGAMSTNALAAAVVDEDARDVDGVLYKLTTDGDKHYAEVVGVNSSASAAQKKTITIAKEVVGGTGYTYLVTKINTDWETKNANVTATCTSLTINTDNLDANLTTLALNGFTKLETLVIADENAKTKTTAFSGGFTTDAKKTLTSVTLSANIKMIGTDAFNGCANITSFDLQNIEEIGNQAFMGTMIEELTIPATVKSIGTDAFKSMYTAASGTPGSADYVPAKGLKTLVFNVNDAITSIPSAFRGDDLLASVTIVSAKATGFAGSVFKESTHLETVDLSGCTALTSIGTDNFPASDAFKSVKLKGTKLTNLDGLDFSKSQKTLEEITLPTTLTALANKKFFNCVALKSIDLSETGVKAIPDEAFKVDGTLKDAKGKVIAPVLATVKLNAETTTIGGGAFMGQSALTTIEGLNQDKLTTITQYAFYGSGLATIDLSNAKNAAFKEIQKHTFAYMKNLTTVKLPTQITSIAEWAFSHDVKLSSLNLEDTKITTLENLFSDGADDEAAPCDALKSLKLPSTLTTVKDYALQFTGLEEIEIPSSVTSWGKNILQGCINLKKFTWKDVYSGITGLSAGSFIGCDKLEEVYFLTTCNPTTVDLTDDYFKGNDKDVLTVYVTPEVYDQLVAKGWTPENSKYATLSGEGKADYKFNAKGLASDGYYYATYFNAKNPTWFSAEQFQVYTAAVSGSKVVLTEATVENGYYKVAKYDASGTDAQKKAIVVIRSKDQNAKVEYKNATFNEISTLDLNANKNALKVETTDKSASRLKFQYKLGAKDGQVKFWRVTSGTIKEGTPYLESDGSKAREFLDIVIDGEATAINFVEAAEETNDGAIYNMQGVRVNNAQKGIYIKNGKKFIVK